ncbi:transglutaminase-like domain-containing protein [Naasia aerilata]|nr:transglutaminase-like domain-containing protein [Naasia aerilata]
MPSIIADTAATVTADAGTGYDKAVALQDYLRGRDFTYDEETPQRADGDGDSMDVIAAFLDAKRGYCVHFASAMTVMARTLGIPARIAVGYQPGERRINQPGVFEVTSHDLHAWPELYFEGAGWVRFEPTPGRGDVPRYRQDAQASGTDPSSAPTPTPSAAARSDRSEEDAAAAAGGSAGGPPLGGAALGAGVLVLLGAPALARALRRRRRLAALRVPRAGPAWDEVHDTALDLGILQSGADTPRALAARLEEVLSPSPEEHAQLQKLLAVVERERFARPGTTGDAADERAVHGLLHRMRAGRSRGARLRATLLPKSLVTWALSLRRPETPATAS